MSALTDVPELAPRVIELWEVRAKIRNATALSERAHQWLRAYTEHEVLAVGKRQVVERRTQVRSSYRRFATDKLKRFHRVEYERCRLLVPQHTVRHLTAQPDGGDYGELLEAVPGEASLAELKKVVTLNQAHKEKLRLAPFLRELRHDEERLKSQLEAVAAGYLEDGRWDGTAFSFDDGWTYGARVRKFSTDEALKILAPEIVDQYSDVVPEQVITQVVVIGPDGRRNDSGGPDANPFEGD